MSLRRLVLRSLLFHWRTGLAVCFGLALATAVITGALVIGDSVTGSLRDTALARLGSIDYALVAPHFFREKLAADLAAGGAASRLVPVLLATGAARSAVSEAVVPQASVLGVTDDFWRLFPGAILHLSGRQAAVNAALARDLGLRAGDAFLVTVGRPGEAPVASLFGRRKREDTTRTLRLTVAAVLPGAAGDFRLDPSPAVPRNVFVARAWVGRLLGQTGRGNVLLAAAAPPTAAQSVGALNAALETVCQVTDYGLRVVSSPDRRYLSLQTDAVVMPQTAVDAARRAATALHLRPALTSTYLATAVRDLSASPPTRIVYAVLAALDRWDSLPLQPGGKPPDQEGVCLNAWAAQDLGAKLSDRLEVSYLVPNSDGTYSTHAARLVLRGIAKMAGAGADRGLVPDYEGITNAKRIQDWNPPFPVELGLVTKRDDDYWAQYRAAPKLFVSLDTARAMWQAGPAGKTADWVTSVRVAPLGGATAQTQAAFSKALRQALPPEQVGMIFRPVREQALRAAQGTTDFGQLMLGMSMFLVLSGAGLAAMLMRLSAQRRAAETGLLLACGLTGRQVQGAALAEGATLTGIGALAGVPLGVLYAGAVLAALGHWWRGAVAETSLWLHVRPDAMAGGALAGLVVGMLAVLWAARGLRERRLLDLLAGWQALGVLPALRARRWVVGGLVLALVLAAVLMGLSLTTGQVPAEAAFFSSGALLLVGGLLAGWLALSALLSARRETSSPGRLALRSAAANRGRSLLTLGLLAAATFIIVATAANTRSFSGLDYTRHDSGTGGFALQATSTLPLYYDLGTPEGRAHLGFSPSDEATFSGVRVFSLLMSPGQDISCLNLARPGESPRLLGVPPALEAEGRFTVATAQSEPNPWTLLQRPTAGGLVPAFGDADSVQWSLHSGLGRAYAISGERDTATLRFVGLLAGSIFQSELLVAEAEFKRLFPSVAGPRYFLLDVPPGRETAVAQALRSNLGDLGLQVRATREVLDSYMRVQNTYLSMFVALGGLGVLLGTVGIVTVLLRCALERRAEFALMLATGFDRRDLARLLVLENAALLLAGVLLGTVAALVAVAPQLAAPTFRPQWAQPAVLLVAIVALGFGACWAAARMAVRENLLVALREE